MNRLPLRFNFVIVTIVIIVMSLLSCSDDPPTGPKILKTGPWIQQETPNLKSLNAVWGASSDYIIAVGDQGAIVKYNGQAWDTISTGLYQNLYTIWGTSKENVLIGGQDGLLLHFNGADLKKITIPTGIAVRDIWGFNENEIYAAGDSAKIITYDGNRWSSFTPELSSINQSIVYNSVFGISYIPVHPGIRRPQKLLFVSTNSVFIRIFDKLPSNETDILNKFRATAIHGSSFDQVFTVGYRGLLYKFDGANWEPLESKTTQFLRDVFAIDSKNIIISGNGGTILHYNGSEVSSSTTNPPVNLYGIWGEPGGTMVAVGYNGNIFMSK